MLNLWLPGLNLWLPGLNLWLPGLNLCRIYAKSMAAGLNLSSSNQIPQINAEKKFPRMSDVSCLAAGVVLRLNHHSSRSFL